MLQQKLIIHVKDLALLHHCRTGPSNLKLHLEAFLTSRIQELLDMDCLRFCMATCATFVGTSRCHRLDLDQLIPTLATRRFDEISIYSLRITPSLTPSLG